MLDIRWDGISHDQIVAWTRVGCGPAVTDSLEARLTSVAEALTGSADLVNTTLRRVDGGEWTGNAATVAAEAMRTMRDFDDVLGHHGTVNSLAAYGQSDNASWARANVPEVVDARTTLAPTGGLADVLNSTVDFHNRQRMAKDAEERARQVMREYQAMTVERIAALPPLTPAPRVVIDTSVPIGNRELPHGESTPEDGDTAPAGGHDPNEHPLPTGAKHAAPTGVGLPSELTRAPSAGVSSPLGSDLPDSDMPGSIQPADDPAASRQSATDPAGQPSERLLLPVNGGFPNETLRPGIINLTAPEPPRGTHVTPIAAPIPNRRGDDQEHEVKYLVPSAEIFEPEAENGQLEDPHRPGSFVAPTAIGDDDTE
jgi:hypothetical protein